MHRNLSRTFALVMGIPLLLAILAACGTGAGTTGSGSTSSGSTPTGSTIIKIATDLPVSGKDESSGKPAENGAHLAVDQANANHTIPGYTLVFDPKDDVGPSGIHDPAIGAQNVTALVGDALVAGIVGPFNSNVAKAEMPITNQAPLAQISPANTNTCLTQEGAAIGCTGANDLVPTLRPTHKVTYFRIATTDSHQGPAGADYLYKSKHYKSVYVIDDAETYGIGIADSFSKEWQADGGTLLGRSSEPSTTTSYVSLLTQIAAKHPDVIYFGGLDSTGGILIRQQMGQIAALKTTPMAGGDGIVTPTFASTIGIPPASIYGTVAVIDTSKNPAAKTFVSQYDKVYSTISVYSAAAYDCTNILIQAIKTALAKGAHTPQNSSDVAGAKAFRQAVINAIQNISYNGVTGHQAFDKNGDTTDKIISIYQIATNTSGKPDWIFQDQVTAS
jgi:branched-chain amino acid transport system substrate-binding protein